MSSEHQLKYFFRLCSKDNTEENKKSTVEDYCSLLYGSWYRESTEEISKYFKSYLFSTDKSLVLYSKTATSSKNSDGTYSEWTIYPATSSRGVWFVEQKGDLFYLKIKWNGNGPFYEYIISYLDTKLLNFGEGFSGDLNRGDKSPNF